MPSASKRRTVLPWLFWLSLLCPELSIHLSSGLSCCSDMTRLGSSWTSSLITTTFPSSLCPFKVWIHLRATCAVTMVTSDVSLCVSPRSFLLFHLCPTLVIEHTDSPAEESYPSFLRWFEICFPRAMIYMRPYPVLCY